MFIKYKEYFEAWLNIPAEEAAQTRGVLLYSSEKRKSRPAGWRLYLPVCAFETENALLISCIPEWEKELRCLLKDLPITDAKHKLEEFAVKDKPLYCAQHKFFGLDELNTSIDTKQSMPLDNTHYEQYSAFYRKTYPGLCELVNPDDWMPAEFETMVNKKLHYCVFADNAIVSATVSEDIPNKPNSLIQIGTSTLPEHRRKGYASAACAAFIKHHLRQGLLPMWHCDADNKASAMLAMKLGFRYVGNEIYVSSLTERGR